MRSSFKNLLGAAAIAVATAGAAHATPSFVNPNFIPQNGSGDGNGFYNFTGGSDGWVSTPANSAGYAAHGLFYNNGVGDSNGGSGFLYLGNAGGASASMTQIVGGFDTTHSYKIEIHANSGYPGGTTDLMNILANGASLVGGNVNVNSVNSNGVYTTAFNDIVSGVFVPTSPIETIQFVLNPGSGGDTLLLTNAVIQDLGATVPEPMSIALLAVGLGGVALARRRSAKV